MTRATSAMALTIGLVVGARGALASPPQGVALLHLDASYLHDRQAGTGLGLAGFRLHGLIGTDAPIAYFGGLDLRAGTTNPGGFAYQTDLYLLGGGRRLGRTGLLGVAAGVGASGAVGTLDDAVDLPVEALFEANLGGRLRVLGRARAVWRLAAPGRADGAPHFGWTDELDATFAVRVGHRYRDSGIPSGNGYFVGVSYREARGAQWVGATLGYSVDVGSP